MRDAIILSTWSWKAFGSPERTALALAEKGSKVLYCEMPVSRFRPHSTPTHGRIGDRIFAFRPEYLGEKFSSLPFAASWQWKRVAHDILQQAQALDLREPVFVYSHVPHIAPLCSAMRQAQLPLIHLCVDYPEPYQYELIELSDQTWVIPETVYRDLRSKYGEKIEYIPQSIHLPDSAPGVSSESDPPEWSAIGRPRLGYLGPLYGRVNGALVREVLTQRPEWQFLCFGGGELIGRENVHGIDWVAADRVQQLVAALDVGVMPYDITDKKNLHCVPLKLFDYFLAGLPVVSTRVLSLAEFGDLIYFGDTAPEFISAVEAALAEPAGSDKRETRKRAAREHSTEVLGRRLAELLGRTEEDARAAGSK